MLAGVVREQEPYRPDVANRPGDGRAVPQDEPDVSPDARPDPIGKADRGTLRAGQVGHGLIASPRIGGVELQLHVGKQGGPAHAHTVGPGRRLDARLVHNLDAASTYQVRSVTIIRHLPASLHIVPDDPSGGHRAHVVTHRAPNAQAEPRARTTRRRAPRIGRYRALRGSWPRPRCDRRSDDGEQHRSDRPRRARCSPCAGTRGRRAEGEGESPAEQGGGRSAEHANAMSGQVVRPGRSVHGG